MIMILKKIKHYKDKGNVRGLHLHELIVNNDNGMEWRWEMM